MTVFIGALSVLACGSAALLAVVVLTQEPRSGGLSGLVGSATEGVFDTSTAPLRRFTSVVAAIWIGACAAHALLI